MKAPGTHDRVAGSDSVPEPESEARRKICGPQQEWKCISFQQTTYFSNCIPCYLNVYPDVYLMQIEIHTELEN